MLLLGITVRDPNWTEPCEYGVRMKLATWAAQAGLSRPGRRGLEKKEVEEIKCVTLRCGSVEVAAGAAMTEQPSASDETGIQEAAGLNPLPKGAERQSPWSAERSAQRHSLRSPARADGHDQGGSAASVGLRPRRPFCCSSPRAVWKETAQALARPSRRLRKLALAGKLAISQIS